MRKLLTAATIGCAAILAVSCGSLFTKVQVKASPSLYAPLGGRSVEVSEYVSVEKMADFLGTNSKMRIYDYSSASGDASAAFLAYYPLMDIPVDFSKYMEQLDLTAGLNASLNDIGFTVPELTADTSGVSQTVKVPSSDAYAGRTLGAGEAAAVNALIGAAGTVAIDPASVPVSGGTTFKSAVIKTGYIKLNVTPTVSGLSLDPSGIKITLPGSVAELGFTRTSAGEYLIDLAGKTVTAGTFSVSGSAGISGTVTAGTVVPSKGIGADISCSIHIGELQTVTIGFDQNLEIPITKKMPAEVRDLISEIAFKSDPGLGLRIALTNGLPAGMDVTVTVDSTALGIVSQSASFPAQATTSGSIVNTTNPVLKPGTWIDGNLDITAKIGFPAGVYDATNKTLTVSNITAGRTYSLSGSFGLLAEFESAKIIPGAAGKFNGTYPESGQLDLSSFIDELPAGVELAKDGFEANIYLSSPQSSNTLTMNGEISITSVKGGVSTTTDLVGATGSPQSITFGSALSLPAGASWSGPIPSPSASFGQTLVDVINAKPEAVSLAYSLALNTVTITAADLESGKTSVKAEMLLKIPVALKINGTEQSPADPAVTGVLVDVLDMAGIDPSKDLFGRSQGGTISSEVNKLLDQLTEMKLDIKYVNELGMEMEAFVEDALTGIKRRIVLKQGANTATVSLHASELKSVITSYPFSPTVKIFIPNTEADAPFRLKKNGGISVNVSVSAVTDIDYTYELGGK